MENVFLEVTDGLDTYESSLWIPAGKILSLIVDARPENGSARVSVEAERIRNVRVYPITPWLNSLKEAETARHHLTLVLNAASRTFVVRWRDAGFVAEPR